MLRLLVTTATILSILSALAVFAMLMMQQIYYAYICFAWYVVSSSCWLLLSGVQDRIKR